MLAAIGSRRMVMSFMALLMHGCGLHCFVLFLVLDLSIGPVLALRLRQLTITAAATSTLTSEPRHRPVRSSVQDAVESHNSELIVSAAASLQRAMSSFVMASMSSSERNNVSDSIGKLQPDTRLVRASELPANDSYPHAPDASPDLPFRVGPGTLEEPIRHPQSVTENSSQSAVLRTGVADTVFTGNDTLAWDCVGNRTRLSKLLAFHNCSNGTLSPSSRTLWTLLHSKRQQEHLNSSTNCSFLLEESGLCRTLLRLATDVSKKKDKNSEPSFPLPLLISVIIGSSIACLIAIGALFACVCYRNTQKYSVNYLNSYWQSTQAENTIGYVNGSTDSNKSLDDEVLSLDNDNFLHSIENLTFSRMVRDAKMNTTQI